MILQKRPHRKQARIHYPNSFPPKNNSRRKKAETKEPIKETNKKQDVKDTVKDQMEKPSIEKKERNKSVERKNKDKKKDKSEHIGDTGKKSDPMQDGVSKIDYKPEKSSRDNKYKQSDKPSKTDVSTKDKFNTDKADSVKREETQEHQPVLNDLSPISEKGTEKCTNNERDSINTILPKLNEIKKEEVVPENIEKEKEKSFIRKTERPLQKERALIFDSEDESMPLAAFSEEKSKRDSESNIFNLPSLESSVEKDVQPAKPVGSSWGAPILMQLETELEDSIRAAKKQKENRASKAKMFKPKETIKSNEPEPVLSKLGGKAFDEQPEEEEVKVSKKESESPETVEDTNVKMPDKVPDVPVPEPNFTPAAESGKQPEAEPEEVPVKSEKQPEPDSFSDLDIDKHSKPISLEIPGETKKEEKTEMKVSPVVVTQEQLDQATQSITLLSEPVKPKTEHTPVEVIQATEKPEEEEGEPQEQSEEQQEESRLAADRLMEMMGFSMPEPVQAEVNPLADFWSVGEQTDSETVDAVQALEGKIPERNESIDISEETAKKDVSGPPDLPPTDLPLSPKPAENESTAEVPASVELPQKPEEKKTPRNSVDDTIASVVAASTAEANYTNTVVSEAVLHKEPEIEVELPKAKGKRTKKSKTKKKAEEEKLVHGENLLNTDQTHSVDHTAAESQENRVPSPGLLMVQPVSLKLRPTKHSPQPAAVQESKFPADFPVMKESPLVYHAERHSPRDLHASKLSPSNLHSTPSFSAAEAYKFPPDDDPSDDLPHTVSLYKSPSHALSVKQTLGASPFRMKESPTADLGGDLSDDPTTLVIDTDVVPEEKVDTEKPVLQEQDEKPKQDLTAKDQTTVVQSQPEVDPLTMSNRKYSEEESLESSEVKPAGDTPELPEQKVDTRPRRGKRNRRLTARSEADDQHHPDEEKTQNEHHPPETEKSPPGITSRMRSRSSEQTAKKTAEVKESTEGPERVSSRGRKIIPKEPKEIFDEVPGISRKGRRGSAQKEAETEPPRVRSRRLAGTQPTETDQEPRTPRRNRRTSTRISKEDEMPGDVKESNFDMHDDAEEKEELEESPTKSRRNLRRRTQRRIVAREPEEDKQEDLVTIDPDVSGSLLRPDDSSTDTTSAADTSTDTFDNSGTPKKRGRGRPKGSTNKKQQEAPFGKSKTSDGANSPRARGLEMGSTSPKGGDISAPFVKLEKLPLGWRRDDGLTLDAKKDKFDDQRSGEKPKKDLYEWEDEEETPVTELFTPKRSRKRKNFEQNTGPIPPLKVNLSDKCVEEVTEVSAPEPKKVKQDEAEEKVEELKPAIPEVSAVVNVEPVKPAAVDLKPGIERKSGTESSMMTMHLPAKLAYKQEIHEAQRQQQQLQLKLQLQKQAENSTVPTTSNPLPDTNPAMTAMSGGTGDSISNIDRIIEAVANGNFEREDDFDYYLKKRQVRSRTWSEERATILTSATSSAPTTPSVVTSAPPVSSHVSSASLSWSQAHHMTSQTVATTSSPAVSAGVISVAGQPLAASRQPLVTSVSSDDARKNMIPSPPRNVSHQPDNERPLQEPMKTLTSHSGPLTVQQALVPLGSSPRMPGAPQVVTHPTTASHAFSPGMQPSPTIKSPAVQTSSPLLQQQQAAAVPVSSQPNPILALQKAGYPVTSQEIVSQQFREPTPKDVKSQVPPSSMGQGSDHRVQVTIAGPPQPVSSAAVHVGIVQGQAQTLTQRETSPQGQVCCQPCDIPLSVSRTIPPSKVIEKVPNPMALGLAQGPPSQPSPHPAQPPSHQQVEPRMAVVQSPRRQPSPQQVPVSRELQGPKSQQLSPHIVPPHPQSHPQSHPSYPQPQVPPYASLPPQHHLPHPQQQQPGSAGSASQQASELRAVLNQPSKIVQQQQRLQQASNQQQSKQMSVHQQAQSQANLCSPNPQRVEQHKGSLSGQHHMPHMVVEPRGQQVNRVEAKVSQPQTGPSHIQPNTSSTYASQMDLRSGHTDAHRFPVSAHPDPRMPVTQQLYANELAIHGQAMWATGGVPRVPVDPRVMLSAPGHHSDYLAAASGHLLSGMVPQTIPQHLQQFMHQTGAQLDRHPTQEVSRPPSARPPSRLTPPSQPSPRNTPTSHPMPPSAHHPPSSLPTQSTAEMNRMGQDFHSPHSHIQGLMRIQQRYPVMWQGQLALKNDTSQVQMHFISGSQQLARVALPPLGPDGSCAALRIMQRMRLEPQQLDGVARRMQNDEEYTMLIAVPCGHDAIDLMTQQRTLGTWFIQYLREKQAAGIVNMPGSIPGQTAYVIHIFPPCDFASQNLARVAPEFVGNIGDIPFLLIVIATC